MKNLLNIVLALTLPFALQAETDEAKTKLEGKMASIQSDIEKNSFFNENLNQIREVKTLLQDQGSSEKNQQNRHKAIAKISKLPLQIQILFKEELDLLLNLTNSQDKNKVAEILLNLKSRDIVPDPTLPNTKSIAKTNTENHYKLLKYKKILENQERFRKKIIECNLDSDTLGKINQKLSQQLETGKKAIAEINLRKTKIKQEYEVSTKDMRPILQQIDSLNGEIFSFKFDYTNVKNEDPQAMKKFVEKVASRHSCFSLNIQRELLSPIEGKNYWGGEKTEDFVSWLTSLEKKQPFSNELQKEIINRYSKLCRSSDDIVMMQLEHAVEAGVKMTLQNLNFDKLKEVNKLTPKLRNALGPHIKWVEFEKNFDVNLKKLVDVEKDYATRYSNFLEKKTNICAEKDRLASEYQKLLSNHIDSIDEIISALPTLNSKARDLKKQAESLEHEP